MVSRYVFLHVLRPGSNSLALVTRAGNQPEEQARLKTAAAMADGGDLQEIVDKIWTSEIPAPDELSSTV